MHNNIMAAGLRDRLPMLATGRYAQWRSPVPETDNSPTVPEHTTVKTLLNMSLKNKAHFKSKKEAIHLILTGIGDEIYSTVDACKTTHEIIAKDANPLALVATAQPNQDSYYQTPKSQKSYAPTSKALLPTRSHETTRNKGKEIAKPITPPSESASEEDSDPEQSQRDKDMQKNLFGNQRIVNVVEARENMLRCKQAEKGVPLQAEQFDWLADKDEEIDEQELEAHYSYMAKIQEVPTADSGTDSEPLEQVQYDVGYNVFVNEIQHFEQSESISNTCVVETDDSNVIPDSPNMCDNDISNDQNAVECDDEHVALANLIANLKLDVMKIKRFKRKQTQHLLMN
uniref:Gag-Pol polyprotein n=1 Tax=Tanacetum cinerariifolium TaxID=118510 RepID=A0A699J3X9_TANCI|nr:hypothetical protein [Tanacetum cinerariifolium]